MGYGELDKTADIDLFEQAFCLDIGRGDPRRGSPPCPGAQGEVLGIVELKIVR